MVAVTAVLDWQLAAVALAVTPVLFGLTQYFRRRLRAVWEGVKELESSALGIVPGNHGRATRGEIVRPGGA
jgi:ABC-type bacteriocin/lantibiotic exporter with double-glycine peptidase domain